MLLSIHKPSRIQTKPQGKCVGKGKPEITVIKFLPSDDIRICINSWERLLKSRETYILHAFIQWHTGNFCKLHLEFQVLLYGQGSFWVEVGVDNSTIYRPYYQWMWATWGSLEQWRPKFRWRVSSGGTGSDEDQSTGRGLALERSDHPSFWGWRERWSDTRGHDVSHETSTIKG